MLMSSDKTLLIAHVVLACILGVFAGGLYYQVGVTIAGFQNRVGSLFFLGSLIAFSSLRYAASLANMGGQMLMLVHCTTWWKCEVCSYENERATFTREFTS